LCSDLTSESVDLANFLVSHAIQPVTLAAMAAAQAAIAIQVELSPPFAA
jgi:hypothetical protein